MKTYGSNESATQSDRPTRAPEETAELHDAFNSEIVDNRASVSTAQRLQRLANSSPKAMQLKRQADLVTSGAGSARTQNFQRMADNAHRATQLKRHADMTGSAQTAPLQREKRPNNTGLPDQLKSGIETLSGMSMDHVEVHYNSDKPAQLQARAYAQGSEIYVAPGQEKHLPHEAWHIVQQAQGRVHSTHLVIHKSCARCRPR